MEEFELICQQNKDVVYRYLLTLCRDPHVAEELTSETFYRAFLHIDRFRGECRVTTWLCQIAKNIYIKEMKKEKHDSLDTVFELADSEHFLEKLCEKEQVLEIFQSVHSLQGTYKEVFLLRVLGNLSFKEIAQVFSKTDTWARVTFYRAKEKLILDLEGKNDD